MHINDLDDTVLGVVEAAFMEGQPVTYAVGPMADRRVVQQFRQRDLVAPKDRLCGSINRLVRMGVLRKEATGELMIGSGSCGVHHYEVIELQPI